MGFSLEYGNLSLAIYLFVENTNFQFVMLLLSNFFTFSALQYLCNLETLYNENTIICIIIILINFIL